MKANQAEHLGLAQVEASRRQRHLYFPPSTHQVAPSVLAWLEWVLWLGGFLHLGPFGVLDERPPGLGGIRKHHGARFAGVWS